MRSWDSCFHHCEVLQFGWGGGVGGRIRPGGGFFLVKAEGCVFFLRALAFFSQGRLA